MDAGHVGRRKFPSYTTEELKIAVINYKIGMHPCGDPQPGHVEAMVMEIAARETGASKRFKVPQV